MQPPAEERGHGLARGEVDAGVDGHVHEVGHEIQDEPDKRVDVEGAEHDRVVAVDGGLEAQEPEPVEREDDLDEEGAGEQDAHEGGGEAGHHDEHGVAEDVAVEDPPPGEALGARGHHVLLVDLLQEGVLGQHGEPGEAADDQRRHRQRDVPEVVGDALGPAHVPPSLGDEPAQGEPRHEAPPREEHDEEDGEEEAGNGVADDDDPARPDVEGGAVAHRLGHAERDGDR